MTRRPKRCARCKKEINPPWSSVISRYYTLATRIISPQTGKPLTILGVDYCSLQCVHAATAIDPAAASGTETP